jgi:hypothetical protein
VLVGLAVIGAAAVSTTSASAGVSNSGPISIHFVANKTLKVTLSSLHAPTGSTFVRVVGKGTLIPSPVIFSIN